MQTKLHRALMAPFDTVVERAKAKGEIPPDKSTADIIAKTAGPLFYRRWFSKEPIDARFIDAIVTAAVSKK